MTRFILSTTAILVLSVFPAFAETPIQTSAKQAIVIDYETSMVLMEKNAAQPMPTSSMSKVMTMYMVFEALKKGHLALDDEFQVSEKAWRKGGSKMFVEVDKRIRIEDLIRGVIVQSGNDATIVLAEGLAGSESAFAESLNTKARELGMANSNFTNASGWPDPNHYSTAQDLAILAQALITNFPKYYPYYAEQSYTYNNIAQDNRNPLLYKNIGGDGIKTGHTEAGGYGLIGSGVHNGRRVIMVVNGLENEKARAQESSKLLEWGLRRFENHRLFAKGEIVETANIIMGQKEAIGLILDQDLDITIPTIALKELKVTANLQEPLTAPVTKGQEIGMLMVDIPHIGRLQRPLYAADNVEELGFFALTLAKMKTFIGQGATATP